MPADRVLAAMETGPMISMASRRTAAERRAIAEFVSGKAIGTRLETAPPAKAMCPAVATVATIVWTGWGKNTSNTRFQESGGITAAEVPRLKVKWAFGFPGDLNANAHPTIAGGRVFVGSPGGKVYSLNAETGCVHWFFDAESRCEVRSRWRGETLPDQATRPFSETPRPTSMRWTQPPESSSGRQKWTSFRSRESPALLCFTTGGCMSAYSPAKKPPALFRSTNAANFAAVWWLWMPSPVSRSGRRTRLTNPEDQEEQSGRAVMGSLGRPSGARRPSTRSATWSTSPPGTTIAIRPNA